MDEQATNDNAPESAGDLGPGPVTGPLPPYDPAKFSTYYWLMFSFYVAGSLLAIILIGLLIIPVALIFWGMFSYMAWKQIQDGHQRTSPGLAVGLMFIPLWNFYWCFVSFYGLAKSTNDYQVRWNTSSVPVNEGLALTACILYCTAIIPYLGLITGLVGSVMWLIVMFQIKNASAAIAEARLDGVGHPAG